MAFSVLWYESPKVTQHRKDHSDWGIEANNTKNEKWKQQRHDQN